MTLSKIEPVRTRPGRTCAVRWLLEHQLDHDDAVTASVWMDDPHVPASWIIQTLWREMGIQLSDQAVNRHRRGRRGLSNGCSCPRIAA
jgi:hypothetical protein